MFATAAAAWVGTALALHRVNGKCLSDGGGLTVGDGPRRGAPYGRALGLRLLRLGPPAAAARGRTRAAEVAVLRVLELRVAAVDAPALGGGQLRPAPRRGVETVPPVALERER